MKPERANMHDDRWCSVDPCPTCIEEQCEREKDKLDDCIEAVLDFEKFLEHFWQSHDRVFKAK